MESERPTLLMCQCEHYYYIKLEILAELTLNTRVMCIPIKKGSHSWFRELPNFHVNFTWCIILEGHSTSLYKVAVCDTNFRTNCPHKSCLKKLNKVPINIFDNLIFIKLNDECIFYEFGEIFCKSFFSGAQPNSIFSIFCPLIHYSFFLDVEKLIFTFSNTFQPRISKSQR